MPQPPAGLPPRSGSPAAPDPPANAPSRSGVPAPPSPSSARAEPGRAWLDALLHELASTPDLQAALTACVRGLRRSLPYFNWVGAYMIQGTDLVLGPWEGPAATEHVRIPVGTGVCGAAAASGHTEVVDDVNADPRYLACFLQTRAELVVPIAAGGRVYGEIDVDSDRRAAFGAADVAAVEALCGALAARAAAAAHPYHVPAVGPAR